MSTVVARDEAHGIVRFVRGTCASMLTTFFSLVKILVVWKKILLMCLYVGMYMYIAYTHKSNRVLTYVPTYLLTRRRRPAQSLVTYIPNIPNDFLQCVT